MTHAVLPLLLIACAPNDDLDPADIDTPVEESDTTPSEPDTEVDEPYSPAPGIWVNEAADDWHLVRRQSLVCFTFRWLEADEHWAILAVGMDDSRTHKLAWGFTLPEAAQNAFTFGNMAGDYFRSELFLPAGTWGNLRIGLFNGDLEAVPVQRGSLQHTGGQLISGGVQAWRTWEAMMDLGNQGRFIPGGNLAHAAAGDDGKLYRATDEGIEWVRLDDGARIQRWSWPEAFGDPRDIYGMDVVGDQVVFHRRDRTLITRARWTLGDPTPLHTEVIDGMADPNDLPTGCTADRL